MELSSPDREPTPPPPSPSDGELVARVLAGDTSAFDELIRRYQRQAVAVSYRLLNNVDDALEVTQNAFVKAYASLASLEKVESFGGWLMRIVSNLSLNFRRGRAGRRHLSLHDGGDEGQADAPVQQQWQSNTAGPLHQLQSQEMGEKLKNAMSQLSDKQRQALVMFTIEKMPQKQVAQTLKCSVEAVKWHVFQARKRLKELLADYL